MTRRIVAGSEVAVVAGGERTASLPLNTVTVPRRVSRSSRRCFGGGVVFVDIMVFSTIAEHMCLMALAVRWLGLCVTARSKSAPIRKSSQIAASAGSSVSLTAR